MKKARLTLATLVLLVWSGVSLAQSGAFKVVVNGSNPVTSLSKDELSKLFMKKTSTWADGRKVVPVDLAEGSSARTGFSESVHGKSVQAVKAYWQQMIFSGRQVPPSEKASPREVVAFVETNPGAVGYVPSGTEVGKCKVVEVR